MKNYNTANVEIDWKKINDNEAKLKVLERLVENWSLQLPPHFYKVAVSILKNK